MTRAHDDLEQPAVSVIVPTRNNEQTLANCLRSIRGQTDSHAELIVVDNRSTDATRTIAAKFADKIAEGGPERSAQRNIGAGMASGSYFLFIDSDMILSRSVLAETVDRFQKDPNAIALILPELVKEDANFWVRCRALEKRAYLGDEKAEAARAFRASWFRESGGFDESLTGPEDWELTDRARMSGSIGRIQATILHDESGLSLTETFSKKRYYGRSWLGYLRKSGSSKFGRIVRPSLISPLKSIVVDPVHVVGLYVLKVIELLGFTIGAIEGGLARRNRTT